MERVSTHRQQMWNTDEDTDRKGHCDHGKDIKLNNMPLQLHQGQNQFHVISVQTPKDRF